MIKEKLSQVAAGAKGLDMGILVSKATDLAKKIDLKAAKNKVYDVIDSPKADHVKSAINVAGAFLVDGVAFAKGVVEDHLHKD